jgi:hypothetical protein
LDLTEAITMRVRDEMRQTNVAVLAREREVIRREETERAKSQTATEHEDLQVQLKENEVRFAEYRRTELDLRKRERALEIKLEETELIVRRREAELRTEIKAEEKEHYAARLREKDDQLSRVRKQLAEAHSKAESEARLQEGRARQDLFAEELADRFAHDRVAVVRQGQAGADIRQEVMDERYGDCGEILWEVKRAVRWSRDWPAKLSADRQKAGSDIAVLVCSAMPPGIDSATPLGDVWVVDFEHALTLAFALRATLAELALHRHNNAARADAAGRVFDYVATGGFAHRVLSLGKYLTAQQECLDQERKAMSRIWAARQSGLDASWTILAALVGDLEGLGARMPEDVRFPLSPPPAALGPGRAPE